MALCASVSIPTDGFRLGAMLSIHSDVRVEYERLVPLDSRGVSYLWVTGIDTDEAIDLLGADPDVAAAEPIAESREGVLAGVEWTADHPLLDTLAAVDATCLRAVGSADGWRLSLRFRSRDRLADCYRQCVSDEIPLTVEQIHTTAWSVEGGHEAVLTGVQRETLAAALDQGYFAVPRTATLQDLAREFDVSDTAISQRIRRGVARLLAAELTGDRPSDVRPVSTEPR